MGFFDEVGMFRPTIDDLAPSKVVGGVGASGPYEPKQGGVGAWGVSWADYPPLDRTDVGVGAGVRQGVRGGVGASAGDGTWFGSGSDLAGSFGDWLRSAESERKRIAKWEARQRRKKGKKAKKGKRPVGDRVLIGGGSVAEPTVPGYSLSSDSAITSGLPNINVPNVDKRVNQIVNSLIKADKMQRENALLDLRGQYQGAGMGIGRGGLAYDKIVRGLAAASDVMGEREIAEANKMKDIVAQDAGGIDPAGTATAFAAKAAESEDAGSVAAGLDTAQREKQAQLSFFNSMRGADRMRVNEELANLAGEYRGAQSELEREARARSLELPLKRMEIEQSLQDNAIKKALAAFELAAARENIINSKFGRESGRAELGMKQDQIKYERAMAAQERKDRAREAKMKQKEWLAANTAKKQNIINEILYGKVEKRKVLRGYSPTEQPVYEDVYEPVGALPSSVGEAVLMLRNAGVGKAEANRIAKQWWGRSILPQQVAGIGAAAGGFLGGFGDGS